jgi:outer membrane receptor protein involved in Fe transport
MFKRTKISTGLVLAFGMGVPLLTIAQGQLERVEVTGSRIKSFDVDTSSPVVKLGTEAIKIEGVRSVEQLLNNLPQVFSDYGSTVSNGATGTATVDLRGLGRSRTLVLVNNRRLPAGSPREYAADLNQIPLSLVKRVDVLTGGASAVYGSDAVAGVVNFIMNDNFEGVQIDLNHNFYNHKQKGDIDYALDARNFPKPGSITSDGEVNDLSLTMGANFAGNKGNATLFIGYKKEAALLQSERDFSACSLGNKGNQFTCAGSSTSFPGRFLMPSGQSLTVADAAGNTRPYVGAADAYNFGPLNYFQRPSERYTMSAFGNYSINEVAKVYSEISFHDDHTVAQIAPSGLFFGNEYAISNENPLLSAAWRTGLGFAAPTDTASILIGRRNVEGGGRQDDIRHTSFRAVAGVKGDVGAWTYDVSAQVGKVIYQEAYLNDFSITRAQRALDVVSGAGGAPVCRSVVNGTDPNCVPYNIWALNQVTPAALAYLQTPGLQKGFTSQIVYTAGGSVDLGTYGLKLPNAKTGVGLAFGIESRHEALDLTTDAAFTTGDLAGQGGPTISLGGSQSVRDIYGEIKIPILEKQPFAELLAVDASYRNSNYSSGKKTNTYGLGIQYAPVKEATLRGSVQQAVRAANIIELYQAQGLALYNNDRDPCAGDPADPVVANRPTATLAQCQNTGVTPAQYGTILDNPAGQYNQIVGGNPNLNPEKANSYTLGIVLQPLRDLNVTVDYFSFTVKDAISTLDPTTTLQQCLDNGNPTVCSLIHRDARGSLWLGNANIEATNKNLSQLKTEGIDFGVDYRFNLQGNGRVDLTLLGTALLKFETEEAPGFGSYDCAGYYGTTCGSPAPKWRHKIRTTWTTPWDLGLSLTWRYFGAVDYEITSDNPLLTGTAAARTNAAAQASFSAQNYFDLAGSYQVNKNVTVRMAINNLFDKDPPIGSVGAPFGNGNTYPGVYDALGRRIALNLTATF